MATVLKAEFDGGRGGSDCLGCCIADRQIAEFRMVMRLLLDSEGVEATAAIAAAERLLEGYDTIDREDEAEEERGRFHVATHCDCGTFKGSGTSYCPECDKEALARLAELQPEPANVVNLHDPF